VVFDEIAEEVFFHAPRLSAANFANRVDACCNDFRAHTWVYKFFRQLMDDWSQDVGRCKVVGRLSKRYKNNSDAKLVVCEIPIEN
jgi:hypothetical protein